MTGQSIETPKQVKQVLAWAVQVSGGCCIPKLQYKADHYCMLVSKQLQDALHKANLLPMLSGLVLLSCLQGRIWWMLEGHVQLCHKCDRI